MKLIIDTLGGDHSPQAPVGGSVRALQAHPELSLVLVGDEPALRKLLEERQAPMDRIELVHAPGVITGEDKPTDAIRLKKDASMIAALARLRTDGDCDGLVSIGATGALVAAATLRIGRIRGIRRPAFCPILPTMDGGLVGICDSGANVDVPPEQLQQQAIMASLYLQTAFGVKAPRVALLNVGVETEKGDDLRKQAFPLLRQTPGINFVGNMESRDLLSGKYDVVVCDGFSGNVLCKTTEGTALELLKKLKREIYAKKRYKLGALFMKKMFTDMKEFMNYQNYGGSVLLGTEKTIVKGHGSSDEKAVEVCIDQACRMTLGELNGKISAAIAAVTEKETANV